MGKKKSFIDKKTAHHFHVVHRSERDPRKDDPDASEFVLLSTKAQVEYDEGTGEMQSTALQRNNDGTTSGFLGEDRLNEFGEIDGYDYSQHMKEMGGGVFIDSTGHVDSSGQAQIVGFALPDEALPPDFEHDRMLTSIAISNKSLDPEIRAALEDPEAFEDMKDDFVEDFDEEGEDEEGFDYEAHIAKLMAAAGSDDEEEGEDYDFSNEEEEDDDRDRTEQQELLDEQFEKAMLEYDSDQVGELASDDEEVMDGGIDLESDVLESVMDEFLEQKPLMNTLRKIQNKESLSLRGQHTTKVFNEGRPVKAAKSPSAATGTAEAEVAGAEGGGEESDEDYGSEAEDTFETMAQDGGAFQRQLEEEDAYMRPKSKAKWDCETIISTYSNLENHPSEIDIPTNPKGKKKKKEQMSPDEIERLTLEQLRLSDEASKVDLSVKTGLPMGVLPVKYAGGRTGLEEDEDDEDYEEEELKNKGKARPKKESKEEKKARKAAVKAERQKRREEKKMLKTHYHKETIKQEKCSGNRGQSIFTY